MLPLISINQISKTMGSTALFSNLSFGVFPKEKTGLIGSNGAGKSTLLKILAQIIKPDHGEIHQQKGLRIAYASQEQVSIPSKSILKVISESLQRVTSLDEIECDIRASIYLSQAGFENLDLSTSELSGGWNKRLNICLAISQEPDLLILDEPTNHLDWDGILWLESWLKTFNGALLLVSHDRTFLNQNTNRIIEINRLYPEGYLAFTCNYDQFLIEKKNFIEKQIADQAKLENKARREVDWLRAGVQARTTKSRSRIDRAYQLLDDLQDVKFRNSSVNERSRIQIDTDDRKTKKLIEFKNITLNYGKSPLIENLNLTLGPKSCWGLLGSNGSGKTSLLKAITGANSFFSGTLFTADHLKVVYFDQKRDQLPQTESVLQFLGDGSDYVIFQNQSVHVASYASRFLFDSQKMHLNISQLSGGEQARLLVAKLLLQPVDVLILDEPTNDLDIETIEVLEDSLSTFEGLVLLVSHDRTFLRNLCDRCLAFHGDGTWAEYADVDQWLATRNRVIKSAKKSPNSNSPSANSKVVSTKPKANRKQVDKLKKQIEKMESTLEIKNQELHDANLSGDHNKINEVYQEQSKLEEELLNLYGQLEELTQ